MKLEKVACLEELSDRKLLRLKGPGYDLCIVLTDNKVHAFANRCPHTGARLHASRVRHNVLTCSHHLAQFDLCSGSVLTFPMEGLDVEKTGPLVVFDAEVDADGWVSVDLGEIELYGRGPVR
ncbi:hypothetical protein PSU4_58100 [Pseudonocardia sulfidoxydans NBRC 16205]|uniref:Rieske domain-containing protein n=1 Tax=Pseudonocardia sulfidoxydans NBRC 16205 TaxID=1223511 RepID=A0A511DPV7_9PSEU|nr:Rieske (2Fe-2S) protein [Pseudonocardia sulfidoxydans]GEL26856.1 hypothetical protein PSU4_58100 [Pseudonocardia sulfidoxydans NBRC 16205]